MRMILGILALALLLTSCTMQEADFAQCVQHSECETPYSYLTRSSCPFSSYCVDSKCEVGCPQMMEPNPAHPDIADPDYISPAEPCQTDSDCSCNYAADDFKSCNCIDNKCVALVTPII